MNMHIKKDDMVIVLSGKDKGKKGKVLMASPDEGKVIVEKVSVATKHKKPRRQGEAGGIIKQETPIYACKVMRICPKCSKPTRPAYEILESGEKVRVCKHCGETI
ncbi:50S ribosomal protein L24 [bioreactor metagenome]|uniref:50S ribosomal protein L24 n=1 Tax=bioreactor metagenome TaxID=1076179 RepID=A0A645HMU1_9ZZZZ